MSAAPRDLIKTKPQRIGEVYYALHEKVGQADSQLVSFGGNLTVGSPNTSFALSDTEFVIGQAIVNKAAVTSVVIPTTVNDTAAGQFRKVLIEINAAGTISFKTGVLSTVDQASAALPKGDTDKVSLGWLELPASFTAGSTPVTLAMLKPMPYWT